MIISVILPTIRPYLIEQRLKEWDTALALVPPSELIVVADFPSPNGHSPWYVRGRNGVIDAINLGYGVARGEFVFVTNDEAIPEPDVLHQLYQAAVQMPGCLLTPLHLPPFPFQYYGKPFAPFPFARKTLFDQIGGMFDPAFKAFYADPDLGMRAHAAGVPIHTVQTAAIHHHNAEGKAEQWDAYFTNDRATFRARWDHLGAFRDP